MSETTINLEAPEAAPAEATPPAEVAAIAADVAAATAEAAIAEATAPASSEPPAPPNSSIASELSAEHLRLMRENFDLMYRKVEQLSQMFQASAQTLLEVADEMRTTMDLAQQMISRQDEQVERIGLAAAALAQVEARLSAHLAHGSKS